MSDIETLRRIYNACDPNKPATEEYYINCSPARGSGSLAQEFQRRLLLTENHLRFLFSGHIGCGKSSELADLQRKLEGPSQPHKCYFPILLNVSDYLDDFDASTTEILLAIVSEVAAAFREKLSIELKDNYFVKRWDEIKKILIKDDWDIVDIEVPLSGAKLKFERLKKDPIARDEVRKKLLPHTSSMLEEINSVFDEARLRLKQLNQARKQPYHDIVILMDNLEKIRRIDGKEEGLESQRELFLERYIQLTGMTAHFLYTVPLRLVRSTEGPQLEQRYGQSFVLPMVKVMERGNRAPYIAGDQCLRELLLHRLGGLKLEEVFDLDALEFMLTYCGGHVRNLMLFVQNACAYDYTEKLPIDLTAAHRAVQQTVRTFATSIPENHWKLLAQLDRSSDQLIPNGQDEYLVMLENLYVLEYRNGGDDDPFAEAAPWYAVNPIVRELRKFKQAVAVLEKEENE